MAVFRLFLRAGGAGSAMDMESGTGARGNVLANKHKIAQSRHKEFGQLVCKERILMKKAVLGLGLAVMVLSGCMAVDGGASDGVLAKVPDEVLAIADPKQNLGAVRVNPVDGCFEYRHIGPVETTFLPLRSTEGRPICTQIPA